MSHELTNAQRLAHMREDLRRKKDCLKILDKTEYRIEKLGCGKEKKVLIPNKDAKRVSELKIEIKELTQQIETYEQQL